MGRRILQFEGPVACPCDDLPARPRDDRAHGYLATRGGGFRLGEGGIHGTGGCFRFGCHGRTLPRACSLGKRQLPVGRGSC